MDGDLSQSPASCAPLDSKVEPLCIPDLTHMRTLNALIDTPRDHSGVNAYDPEALPELFISTCDELRAGLTRGFTAADVEAIDNAISVSAPTLLPTRQQANLLRPSPQHLFNVYLEHVEVVDILNGLHQAPPIPQPGRKALESLIDTAFTIASPLVPYEFIST